MYNDYDDYDDYDDYEYDDSDDGEFGRGDFADPHGRSALRASSADNPRDCPCPTCHAPNRLTLKDVGLGYQCDECADLQERW